MQRVGGRREGWGIGNGEGGREGGEDGVADEERERQLRKK